MRGIEGIIPEIILLAGGLGSRWKVFPVVTLFTYGIFLTQLRGEVTPLLTLSSNAIQFLWIIVCTTSIIWILHPPRGGAAWSLLVQVSAYGLLLRSSHLAFTWGLMEAGALAGYFFVSAIGKKPESQSVVVRYLGWSITASAFLILGLALRLTEGNGLSYPCLQGNTLSNMLMGVGWAIKVAFIPWHTWLIGIYRALPLPWASWYAIVPKGALLLNLLSFLPSEGQGCEMGLFYFLASVSLLAGYALAWQSENPLEMLFWGTLAQTGYMALAATPGAQANGWAFWSVYGIATLLSFLYVEQPWRGKIGDAIGFLLISNLAGLPPVMGFWVKLGLLWSGFTYFSGLIQIFLVASAILATIAGFALYGRVLWWIWQKAPNQPIPVSYKALYLSGSLGLLIGGFWGIGWA